MELGLGISLLFIFLHSFNLVLFGQVRGKNSLWEDLEGISDFDNAIACTARPQPVTPAAFLLSATNHLCPQWWDPAPETRESQQEGLTLLSSTTSKLNPPLQPLTCNTAKEFTTNNAMLFLTFLPLQRYWRNKLSISLNTFHYLRYLRIDFWERNTATYLVHVVHLYFI